jgi:hypothetical protein
VTQPRKGLYCRSEIQTLLRDAQPLRKEIEGETDKQKKKYAERRRDTATDELIKLYRDVENKAALSPLDLLRVRTFCEQLKKRNGGKLPALLGGAPSKDHKHLLIAVKVEEALAAQTGTRKNVTLAIKQVHETLVVDDKRLVVPVATIRDIHYHYRADREANFALRAELSRRAVDRSSS